MTRRAWLLGLAGFIGGLWLSLGRVGAGPGVFRTIWAEDGTHFLSDALNRPVLATLVQPMHGYYNTLCRALTLPASVVPLKYGPAVLSTEAATVTALMGVLVYVACRTHARSTVTRLVVAAPVVAAPIAENLATTTADNVATLQFGLIYTTMWMLLWVPSARWPRILAFATVLVTALTTMLVVLLAPLALLRTIARPDRLSGGMLAALGLGAGLNVMALSLHLTARPSFLVPRYDPAWALGQVGRMALPFAMFGYRFADPHSVVHGGPVGLAVLAAVIVGVVVVIASTWRTDPQWTVAAVVASQAVLVFCGSIMSAGRVELRYVIMPELALYAALALLLRPRPGATTRASRIHAVAPAVLLAVFVLAVGVANYHLPSGRTVQPRSWPSLVASARAVCRDTAYDRVYVYPSLHGDVVGVPAGTPVPDELPVGWPVLLPCDRLR